jgi:alpha-ketoglutarate-dependent taurine dioxygenase
MADEMLFFAQRGLLVDAVVMEVCLQPGELLLFDNLSLAHGRRGVRAPGELHQRVYGHRALHPGQQIKLRDSVLGAFTS